MKNSSQLYNLASASTQLEELYQNACYQTYLWDLLRTMYLFSKSGYMSASLHNDVYFCFDTKEEEDGFNKAISTLEDVGYQIKIDKDERVVTLYWGPTIIKAEQKRKSCNFDNVEEF